MKFSKYNKRRSCRRTRTDADIIASKIYFDDRVNGKEKPFAEYDRISDRLCGKPSRNIY